MSNNKIKATKTKAEIRRELEREIESYLSHGGEVKKIPTGISGNETNVNMFSQATQFEPKKERTPVTEIVKELEARKKAKTSIMKRSRGPKKKLITDDFGEPLRWVWEES